MIALIQRQRPARYSIAWDPKTCQALSALFTFILFLVFSWSIYLPSKLRAPLTSSPEPKEEIEQDPIQNATLGFQKIYALALPDRKDRVRPLLDAANATNITITVLNAVRDSEISDTGKPKNWPSPQHRVGELGCLVSHVRTWNKMIASNITSAIVMESDADWDLRLSSILKPLPHAISKLVDFTFWPRLPTDAAPSSPPSVSPPPPNPEHPYGLNWDILWFGHCGSNNEGTSRIFSWNDTTTPPENKEFTFDTGLLADQHIPGTRALYTFQRTTCSTAYAVTLPGARKLANYFKEADNNLDLQLSSVCSRHADMICLAIWPQIVTATQGKSNIDHSGAGDVVTVPDDGDEPSDVKGGPALQFSARRNAEKILKEGKGRDDWIARWDTMWVPGDWGKKSKEGKEGKEHGEESKGEKEDEGEDEDEGEGTKDGEEDDEEEEEKYENGKKPKNRKDGRWIEVKLNRTLAFEQGCGA